MRTFIVPIILLVLLNACVPLSQIGPGKEVFHYHYVGADWHTREILILKKDSTYREIRQMFPERTLFKSNKEVKQGTYSRKSEGILLDGVVLLENGEEGRIKSEVMGWWVPFKDCHWHPR